MIMILVKIITILFQTACFERTNCTQFTYFDGSKSRCVLFNSCSEPVSSCKVMMMMFWTNPYFGF